jgi:hypothetical protein
LNKWPSPQFVLSDKLPIQQINFPDGMLFLDGLFARQIVLSSKTPFNSKFYFRAKFQIQTICHF